MFSFILGLSLIWLVNGLEVKSLMLLTASLRPAGVCWGIWLARNDMVFREQHYIGRTSNRWWKSSGAAPSPGNLCSCCVWCRQWSNGAPIWRGSSRPFWSLALPEEAQDWYRQFAKGGPLVARGSIWRSLEQGSWSSSISHFFLLPSLSAVGFLFTWTSIVDFRDVWLCRSL